MGDFALSLAKFGAKCHDRQDIVIRKLALEIYRRLVQRTPVKTGRAQNNWNISHESPDLTELEDGAFEPEIIAEAMTQLNEFSAGGVIWITNNLPYIVPLEEGHSEQAPPGGIFQITLEEFEQIIRQAGGEAKAKRP